MTSAIDSTTSFARARPAFSAIMFDIDDTLFAHHSSVLAGLTSFRARLGPPFDEGDDRATAELWERLADKHYRRYLSGELTHIEQRRARARDFVAQFGQHLDDAAADAWYDVYLAEYTKAWMLHGDTLACLNALASTGIRLGIIANGDLAFQNDKLARLGLDPLFEHVVTSGELGYAKPDARIFKHACQQFRVEPAQTAYVGHRLRTDAIGASGAGLTGVWLDRAGVATVTDIMAARATGVPIIRTLSELPEALGVRV
jgi:putative hydrolase of the HAD superfamily